VRGRIEVARVPRGAGRPRWLRTHLAASDFDHAGSFQAKVTPHRDITPRGLFATRAPTRPNRIGISAVKLIVVEADGLVVEEIDVLDGTPLLDIEPRAAVRLHRQAKAGLDQKNNDRTAADDRFEPGKQP
jgi:tRNA (Thr-GGU) A37 N-methylase